MLVISISDVTELLYKHWTKPTASFENRTNTTPVILDFCEFKNINKHRLKSVHTFI